MYEQTIMFSNKSEELIKWRIVFFITIDLAKVLCSKIFSIFTQNNCFFAPFTLTHFNHFFGGFSLGPKQQGKGDELMIF